MTIANRIKQDLDEMGIRYEVIPHPHSSSSLESARRAHTPSMQVAKGVALKDDKGYALAVLPAAHSLDLKRLEYDIGRRFKLVTEDELSKLFPDCSPGAVPAIGAAYGLDTIVDKSLLEQPEIYFEAGDHEELIHIKESEFEKLTKGAKYDHFSNPER